MRIAWRGRLRKPMTPTVVCLLFFLLSASTTDARRKDNKAKRCERIEVRACANLGYSRTKFPNPFTNITSQAATNNLTRLLPILFELNCTKTNALPFLCSVYVPRCSPKRPLLPPCREFCDRAVGSCRALAASFNIEWPAPLVCSNYPSKAAGKDKCYNGRTSRLREKNPNKGKRKGRCCQFGYAFAKANPTCTLNRVSGKHRKRLVRCRDNTARFVRCCKEKSMRNAAKRMRKKERKDRKLSKILQKQAKKAEREKKRKEKKLARQQKKAERKKKRKQNRKNKKNEQN